MCVFTQDLDIIAIRVVHNPCEPVLMKRTPKDIPEWKTYHVTIYGHPGGDPLTRSIGRIEEHQNGWNSLSKYNWPHIDHYLDIST